MNIKVLGSGCANSRTLEANEVDAPVEKVTDLVEIASYGVMSTPALAIDDQVILAGRVPSVVELADLIPGTAT